MDGWTFVIMGTSPGETVEAEVMGFRRRTVFLKPVKVTDPNPDRVEPECRHFGVCAGCQFQHLAYDRQLEIKRDRLNEYFDRYEELSFEPFREIIPSKRTYGYRNNVKLHGPGEPGFWSVGGLSMLRNEECPVCVDEIEQAIQSGRKDQFDEFRARNVENLLLRASSTGEQYVGPEQVPEEDIRWLTEVIPHPLTGEDVELTVPSHGFWQGNTPMVPRLVEEVVTRVERFSPSHLVEAYAGMGLFGLFCSSTVEEVIGIEINPLSIEAGRRNLKNLGIDNLRFIEGETESNLADVLWTIPSSDSTLLVDPPRSGMPKQALDAVLSHPPEQFLYVSCNPESLSRNLSHLCRTTYEMEELVGIDLFPQTRHLECIAHLSRRNEGF